MDKYYKKQQLRDISISILYFLKYTILLGCYDNYCFLKSFVGVNFAKKILVSVSKSIQKTSNAARIKPIPFRKKSQ